MFFDVVIGMGLLMVGGLLVVEGCVGDVGYGRWGLIVNVGEVGSLGIVWVLEIISSYNWW